MALTITLYSFAKRKNSTKRPDGLTGEALQVVLKHPTSYISPAFLIQRAGGFPFNYVVWGEWYYFIDDIVSTGNERFEVRCSLDVLATLKTYIQASSAFVLYDQTANTEIPDTRLSTKTVRGIRSNSDEFNYIGQISDQGGVVVLGITTEEGVSYFAVSQATASTLLSQLNDHELGNLFPPIEGETVEEILTEVGDSIAVGFQRIFSAGTAPNCITFARQLPLPMGAVPGNTQTITLGQFPTNKSGMEIERRVVADTLTISIPWTFSDWRRRAPYTELYLYCPYFGLVALPVEDIIGETSITIEAVVDLPTGEAVFEVFGYSTNHYIGAYSANLGGSYAMGAAGVNVTRSATGMIGAVAAGAAIMASGGAAAPMAAKLGAAAIAGIIGGNTPSATTISGGGGGASLGLRKKSYIFEITHDTTVEPSSVSSVIGTPAMAAKQLGGLSGFVQTKCAEVSAPFPGPVLAECNSLLDGGFFLE